MNILYPQKNIICNLEIKEAKPTMHEIIEANTYINKELNTTSTLP
jgi:hypothetical protein